MTAFQLVVPAAHTAHGGAPTANARVDDSMGRYLFVEHSCYGCHGGLAGGAMGPSLRDTIWKYGGTDQQIHASIADGRPLGMPSWKEILSDSQINDLVVCIRSLRTSAEPTFFFIGEPALMDSLGIKPAAGVKTTAR